MQQGAKPMAAEAGLLDHPWVKRHKLDVVQYHRMGEAGVFEGNERVELIEGEIVEMAPIGDRHAGTTNRLARALFAVVGDRAVVAVGNPVRLDRYNEPQPDSYEPIGPAVSWAHCFGMDGGEPGNNTSLWLAGATRIRRNRCS